MDRLAALLLALGCAAAAPLPPAAAPGSGFEAALGPRTFSFPADHGPHPGFRQEWWYVTGHLAAPSGERFGFELTFFRFALAPPAPPVAGASAWRARELLMGHFAVSDLAAGRFASRAKLGRAALGLAGATGEPLAVWIDDWHLEEAGAGGGVHWRLAASQPGYALELELGTQAPPVLQGEGGFSRKSPASGDASYYYSLPRLAVRGRLREGARTLAVQGSAWCDREWGSGGLGADQEGWDWFGLQLDDGSTLMFYALRRKGGARDALSAGSFVDAAGTVRPLASAQVQIEVEERHRSRAGTDYPSRWHLKVPALALDLRLRPELYEQELDTRPRYWEGAVALSGTQGAHAVGGVGYVELTGYAQERPSPAGTSPRRPVGR